MTNLDDDDMATEPPTEQENGEDRSGHEDQDTGDEPKEEVEDRDVGHGARDAGDES